MRFLLQAVENLVSKPWGGGWLLELKGIRAPMRVGEAWELSAHPSNPSLVRIDEGLKRLDVLALELDLPDLLVKLLDVEKETSVQVHPSDGDVKRLNEKEKGKPELWFVLDSRRGGELGLGLSKNSSAEEVVRDPSQLPLNRVPAKRGEAYYVPPGTPHSLKGVMVLEVSPISNLTYRLYDPSGREVQLAKALEVANLSKLNASKLEGKAIEGGLRFSSGSFVVEKLSLKGTVELEGPRVVFCSEGGVKLSEKVELRRGRSALLLEGCELQALGKAEILSAFRVTP